MKGGIAMGGTKRKTSGKREYLDDSETYIEVVEHYAEYEEDIPEIENARSTKAELEIIKEVLEEEIKDETA
jgi:hypothetical protein